MHRHGRAVLAPTSEVRTLGHGGRRQLARGLMACEREGSGPPGMTGSTGQGTTCMSPWVCVCSRGCVQPPLAGHEPLHSDRIQAHSHRPTSLPVSHSGVKPDFPRVFSGNTLGAGRACQAGSPTPGANQSPSWGHSAPVCADHLASWSRRLPRQARDSVREPVPPGGLRGAPLVCPRHGGSVRSQRSSALGRPAFLESVDTQLFHSQHVTDTLLKSPALSK